MISEDEKKLAYALLGELRNAPVFPILLKLLSELRPQVPPYRWGKDDNIEEIKAHSLQQQGFDKIFNLINPVKPK